ncbi:MAG: hypothetical protein WD875_01250 [Pirellulales bacterium]
MNERGKRGPRDGSMLVALAAWSGHYFFRYGGTAYEWPAKDIAPLVARRLDPSFLANDFFTNASAEPNPRHAFGFLVTTLARFLGDDWYASLFVLRVVAAFFLPVLWYLVLSGYVRAWFEREQLDGVNERGGFSREDTWPTTFGRLAAALVVVAGLAQVIRPSVAALFSIAWWSPFQPQATSSTYSLMFALCGSSLLLSPARFRTAAGVAAWTVASLLHPAVSLFAILFHGIATFGRWRFPSATAVIAVGWLLPCVLLAIVCRPTVSLDADEFIRQYVLVRHPSHYWPPAFGSLTECPWWHSFFLLTGMMFAAVPYAAWRRDRRLAALALALCGAYAGSVGLQYIAVVAWPNKLLAMLGPVRFSSLGYFAWLLLAAIVVADAAALAARRWRSVRPHVGRTGSAWWKQLLLPRGSALALIALASAYVGVTARDDPFARARRTDPGFYNWIADETPSNGVFAVADDNVSVDLALVAHRAVFAGFGLPFREDFFAEYAFRDALLFGTLEQRAELSRSLPSGSDPKRAFFRRLGPRDFVRIAAERQLDYVIVEADHAENFDAVLPVYGNTTWYVYAIEAIRESLAGR